MVAVALAARVVEVIADLGRAGRFSLPVRVWVHRVRQDGADRGACGRGAVSVVVRDPDKREYAATVDPRFVGDADGPGPDLALLEIDDPAFAGDPAADRAGGGRPGQCSGEPVERCHAVGYPWFAETRSRLRCGTPSTRSGLSRCCRN